MKRWYAVFCKPGDESVAEANLERQGFRAYCPRIAATRNGIGRAPLFPRYLFVELDLDHAPWRAVNGTYGVVGLVQFGQRPSALPVGVIEEIMSREGLDGLIQLPEQVPFLHGDSVVVEAGPLFEQLGIYQGQAGSGRALVLMHLLGREIKVKLPSAQIRGKAA